MDTLNVVCRHPHGTHMNHDHQMISMTAWVKYVETTAIFMLTCDDVGRFRTSTICESQDSLSQILPRTHIATKRWRNGLHAGVWGREGKLRETVKR